MPQTLQTLPTQPVLDRIDRRVLALLQADGRLSNTQLSAQVGLSQSACLRRVQRLERLGVIEGYGARLSPAALGRSETVFIELTLDSQSESALEAFERAVAVSPDVLECHLIAGDYDYLLRVAVASTAEYERVHRRQLATLPHVARIRSLFALRRVMQQMPAMPV